MRLLGIAAAAASLVPLACFSPDPAVGLGCADGDPRCPEGQVCDDTAGVCVPDSSLDTWRDDTAEDFLASTADLAAAAIEAGGAIGPAPYFVEGMGVLGVNALVIGVNNAGNVPWDTIAGYQISGRGFARTSDVSRGSGEPMPGTGLGSGAGITVRYEGEVYLEAGVNGVGLLVDDRGLVELYDPATGDYVRVAAGEEADDPDGSFTAPTTGWYPFRGAVENASGTIRFTLRVRPPGGSMSNVPRERLRVPVDHLQGLALDGFDDVFLGNPLGVSLAQYAIDALAYDGEGHPPDFQGAGNASWTMRYAGQVLVTVPGPYTFLIDSLGGHRAWIDGELVADSGGAAEPGVSTTAAIDLEAGWHDLALDWMKNDDNPTHLTLEVVNGPDLVGAWFPVERTRPVLARRGRWTSSNANTPAAIAEGGMATKTNTPMVPSGVTRLDVVDYSVTVEHDALATLVGTLSIAGGAAQTLFAAGELTGMGTSTTRRRFTDLSPSGSWLTTVADTDAVDTFVGEIVATRVSAIYTGGERPFPTRAVYTSRARDLGPIVAVSGVRWGTRQAAPDDVIVRVRSCDAAEACAAEAWTVVPASGSGAGITARPFVQYQVELASDGDASPALDWIEIDYRR
jgi:hypothetical protein